MTGKFTHWRKSSSSHPDGNCVEVGRAQDGTVGVRDTKGVPTTILEFRSEEWSRFLTSVKETEA
ncbi:DUF397 domain-containing protein [Thermomonospora amylolytica]|uniref:DUF397 domain-containing protein n=1 Tax=Thermomonospora amylolytica TaxID=1411117 RepID=UPI000E6B5A3D|nr:DUF397 domain-containing protein [Thermomonospora amylolytica]